MSGSISWVKQRLATIPPQSRRFRVVNLLWDESRIKRAKACTFYWVMLPTSAVVAGILALLAGFVTAIGWFVGYVPDFSDRVSEGADNPKRAFYDYKYHPRSGKFWRFAPWQVVIPATLLTLLVYSIAAGVLGSIGVFLVEAGGAIARFCVRERYVALVIVLAVAFIYLLGKLVIRNRQRLGAAWNRMCPNVIVPEEATKVQAAKRM